METKIVSVKLDSRSYDIYIGSGLLARIADFIPRELKDSSVFIITDKSIEPLAAEIKAQIEASGARLCAMKVLPSGEKTKSFALVEKVCGWLLDNGIGRDSLILAVGGGVVGDLAGFCASIILRGVPFAQIPTTLLSQVDSSVGGKTGISLPQGKNLVGSFYQPIVVIADIETLKTLPPREVLAGYAEVVKYGLIENAGFFTWLEENGPRIRQLEDAAMAHIIDVSCKSKAAIVQSDERESGRRALLNLGHTFGHALESAAGYGSSLLHGEGVAIGICMAFDLSCRMGLCSEKDRERVEAHLMDLGLPVRASEIEGLSTSVDKLMEIMIHDKKVTGGKMVFVLVKGIGEAFVSKDVPEHLVRAVLKDSLGAESKTAKGRWASAFSTLSQFQKSH